MICSHCGMQNMFGTKFCVKCGNNLMAQSINTSQENQNMNQSMQSSALNQTVHQNIETTLNKNSSAYYQEPSTSNTYINHPNTVKNITVGSCFSICLSFLFKPYTTWKEKLNSFNEFKNSATLAFIVTIVSTLVTVIKTMISSVRVTSYWTSKTTWVWENLKDINYVKLIGTNFLIYLGIIVAIACIYYIGSLIVKKQITFSRFVGISALSIVPVVVCSMIISPLLSIIYAPFGICATIVGGIYTIIILYEVMNSEIKLEGNAKLYFNLSCFSILALATYYFLMKVFTSSIMSGLDNLFK